MLKGLSCHLYGSYFDLEDSGEGGKSACAFGKYLGFFGFFFNPADPRGIT